MKLYVGNILTRVVTGGKDNLLSVEPGSGLKKYFTYTVDGYQHSTAYKQRRWDGTKSLLKYSKFPTGMLPFALKYLKSIGADVEIVDERGEHPQFQDNFITKFGELEMMEHQNEVSQLIKRDTGGIPFYRGIVDAATNAGKTLVIASTHENLGRIPTILVVDSVTVYNKTVGEFSAWFDVGEISSKKYDIKPFTIAMVKTLSNLIKESVNVQRDVAKFKVYMVDECHTAGNTTHCHVSASLVGAAVRIYFSGTPLDTQNKENKLKVLSNSGPIIKTISNREMMDKGVSMEAKVHILPNYDNGQVYYDHNLEYDDKIVKSDSRMDDIINIIHNRHRGQKVMIAFRYHAHGLHLLKELRNGLPGVSIKMVHGETTNNEEVVDEFKTGDLQVLVASTILKQSVNIPCIEVLIMAIGGKDKVTIKQFLGRVIRLDKNNEKDHVDVYDWFDEGDYVSKHSRARIKMYIKEELEVDFEYKRNSQYSPISKY